MPCVHAPVRCSVSVEDRSSENPSAYCRLSVMQAALKVAIFAQLLPSSAGGIETNLLELLRNLQSVDSTLRPLAIGPGDSSAWLRDRVPQTETGSALGSSAAATLHRLSGQVLAAQESPEAVRGPEATAVERLHGPAGLHRRACFGHPRGFAQSDLASWIGRPDHAPRTSRSPDADRGAQGARKCLHSLRFSRAMESPFLKR